MSVLANILGFAGVGLAARFGQLAIQKRNLMSNPGGHAIAMGVFGVVGYYAHQWDLRAAEIIAESKRDIEERRRKELAKAEQRSAQQLAEA
ncbi:hypothetical protein BKA70DRAFT_1262109 [Coprinopsis sp. MPI-PUGE-AT-0042]|nr:hypothetical protein BKA70DRAFT_1262109 [Coprinopsis sp. MPI-PUGE-AT-0042]